MATETIQNISEASNLVKNSLVLRGGLVKKEEKVLVDRNRYGRPINHIRIHTDDEIYHIKYQKTEHMPLADNEIRSAHLENERLKYVIKIFGKGNKTDIGINENVIFDLLELESKLGYNCYLLNAVGASSVHKGESVIYWSKAKDFYSFTMNWGTAIYNSSAYGGTVFLVPSGWMKLWQEPLTSYPTISEVIL